MFHKSVVCAAALCSAASLAWAETPVERGEYLVRGPMSCGNCHTPQGPDGPDMSMELAGGQLVIDEPMMHAVSPNITPAGPVGDWTDAELARAIREGIRPDGSLIGPPMPFSLYKDLSDTDLAAIVAFLRTLKPIENATEKSVYNIPLPPAYGPPVEHVADIPRGPTAEYGKYMAGPIAHCVECHTPMGPQGPMFDTALGQGGFEFPGPWGVSVALQHHLERGRPQGLHRRRDRGDDHRGRAAGRHEDAAADALRLARADDARRPRGGDRLPAHPAAAARQELGAAGRAGRR